MMMSKQVKGATGDFATNIWNKITKFYKCSRVVVVVFSTIQIHITCPNFAGVMFFVYGESQRLVPNTNLLAENIVSYSG